MSISKARDNIRSARRDIADELQDLPTKSLFRNRRKQGKLKRALAATDKAIASLRGL